MRVLAVTVVVLSPTRTSRAPTLAPCLAVTTGLISAPIVERQRHWSASGVRDLRTLRTRRAVALTRIVRSETGLAAGSAADDAHAGLRRTVPVSPSGRAWHGHSAVTARVPTPERPQPGDTVGGMRLAVLPVVAILSLTGALAGTAYADAPSPGDGPGGPGGYLPPLGQVWIPDPGQPLPTPIPEPTAMPYPPPQNGPVKPAPEPADRPDPQTVLDGIEWSIEKVSDGYGGSLLCVTAILPNDTLRSYGCTRPVDLTTTK